MLYRIPCPTDVGMDGRAFSFSLPFGCYPVTKLSLLSRLEGAIRLRYEGSNVHTFNGEREAICVVSIEVPLHSKLYAKVHAYINHRPKLSPHRSGSHHFIFRSFSSSRSLSSSISRSHLLVRELALCTRKEMRG